MKLSRESRYALAALAFLARRVEETMIESREIAEATHAPAAFLAKILAKLMRAGVLTSVRGGGYALARPPEEISVRDALAAVEGADLFARCIFWRDECSEDNPCPLHPTWGVVRPQVEAAMARLTIADLSPEVSIPRVRSN